MKVASGYMRSTGRKKKLLSCILALVGAYKKKMNGLSAKLQNMVISHHSIEENGRDVINHRVKRMLRCAEFSRSGRIATMKPLTESSGLPDYIERNGRIVLIIE